jgi:hypothetical protein
MILGLKLLCRAIELLFGLWGTTQWVGHQLQDAPALGNGLLRMQGRRLSPPLQFLPWSVRYHAAATQVFTHGLLFLLGGSRLGICAWSTLQDFQGVGILGQRGLLLWQYGRRSLRHNGPHHPGGGEVWETGR